MCEARRAEYVRLPDEEGMNFTQAAHAVGVSKRTGKAWRNGNPGTATTSPAAPGRRPRTGSNAPNRARRPRARDCGTRSPPGCAGIGARSR